MPYPTLRPTSRSFDPGDYPVKTFKSQSGAEFRFLYGSRRTGMTLSFEYANIGDGLADDFIEHYDEVRGQFQRFDLPPEILTGWTGTAGALDATNTGNRWRYAEPPAITSVRPGVSTVQVRLVGTT